MTVVMGTEEPVPHWPEGQIDPILIGKLLAWALLADNVTICVCEDAMTLVADWSGLTLFLDGEVPCTGNPALWSNGCVRGSAGVETEPGSDTFHVLEAFACIKASLDPVYASLTFARYAVMSSPLTIWCYASSSLKTRVSYSLSMTQKSSYTFSSSTIKAVKTSMSAFLSTAPVDLREALVTCCLALVLSYFLSSSTVMIEDHIRQKYQCNGTNCLAHFNIN